MKASLGLEFIGDNLAAEHRMWAQMLPKEMGDALDPGVKGPWVAEITGRHPKFGYARSFLRANKDYLRANSIGSRGVYLWYALESGRIYEVYERLSWSRSRRYFCRVTAGKIEEITRDEVEACLSARSAPMS